jgi:GNAT superfamily N-acetyltransferase
MACGYPVLSERKASELSVATTSTKASAAFDLQILIGNSKMATDSTLVSRIVAFSGKSERDVRSRLSMGDAGQAANRVMHIALRDGVVVGWCSSTPGWGGWGGGNCGHWGALAVDRAAQGQGVASALVKAAENRLLQAGCDSVQMEYRYVVGDPAKERLFTWYEGKLGFDGGPRRSGFRMCLKELSAESFQAQHEKRDSPSARLQLQSNVKSSCNDAKRVRSSSTSSSSSSS